VHPRDVTEPILRDDDRAVWEAWMRAAAVHGRTQAFARKVERARVAVIEACEWVEQHPVPGRTEPPGASMSSGKDSTVMGHLIAVLAGCRHVVAVTQQDDLDYPGEHEFAAERAARFGMAQHIVSPHESVRAQIASAAERGELRSYDELHTRASRIPRETFFALLEADNLTRPIAFLGLRREESRNRDRVATWASIEAARLRESGGDGPRSGLTRWHKGSGHWRCYPIADFTGLDVYAYAARYDVSLLPVYQCVGLMHRRDPSRIRVDGWVPGGHTADGQVAWLRRYYPSLYRQLCEWMPDASMYT
jgi:3'-phosphoadenosine 5'-phosphosulfate sulfotransferase (PAPS reductase)/FAD synthetase